MKNDKFNTDEKKETKKITIDEKVVATAGPEFSFKTHEESGKSNSIKKIDRYEESGDRSDDDLDQQESMNPD